MTFISIINWLLVFSSIFAIPCYFLVLYIIVKHRKIAFDSSFWTISLSVGAASTGHLFIDFLIRSLNLGLTERIIKVANVWSPYLAKIIAILHKLTNFSQTTGIVMISFNRFLIILQPSWEHLILTDRSGRTEIAFQWISAVIFVLPVLFTNYEFVTVSNQTDGLAIETIDYQSVVYYYLINDGKLMLESCTHIVLYIAMYRHVRQQRRDKVVQINKRKKTSVQTNYEIRFALAGFIVSLIFIMGSCLFVYGTVLYLLYGIESQLFDALVDVVDFLVAISQPSLLILMSGDLRAYLIKMICKTKSTPPVRAGIAKMIENQHRLTKVAWK